ncbi:MAG: hypothetical protein DI539_28805, partial [Flavobacterium psychrophilum]
NNVKRKEFENYMKWVVSQLNNLHFTATVENISHDEEGFTVNVNGQPFRSRNIIMGAGLTSNIPACCQPFLSSTLFHSSQFLKKYNHYRGKAIAIVGGGQSSCEIIKFILEQNQEDLPSFIHWIFKGHKLNVLEDTPFANELYTPNYSEYIYSLPGEDRVKLIEQEKYTSDGVSKSTLEEVYDLLCHARFNTACKIEIYNDCSLTGLEKKEDHYALHLSNPNCLLESDMLILGTGFYYRMPKCIEHLSERYHTEKGVFMVDNKFRLMPKSPLNGNIFIHNGAKHVRGVADPNLSLIAWRSAIIVNTLLGKEVYKVDNEKTIFQWNGHTTEK